MLFFGLRMSLTLPPLQLPPVSSCCGERARKERRSMSLCQENDSLWLVPTGWPPALLQTGCFLEPWDACSWPLSVKAAGPSPDQGPTGATMRRGETFRTCCMVEFHCSHLCQFLLMMVASASHTCMSSPLSEWLPLLSLCSVALTNHHRF